MRYLLFSSAFIVLGALAPATVEAKSSCGYASHYGVGDGYHGRRAADGSRFDAYGLTAASRTLPFGTLVSVKNQDNGKSVVARISDRGPFHPGRVLDLSYKSFATIADPAQGVVKVCFDVV